jgi:pilus assembly protein CpaE
MLTAGIVSGDSTTAGQLLASLQQSGFVASVKQWMLPGARIDPGEAVPEIVLLDLGRDPENCFSFALNLRRVRAAVKLIACSSVNPPTPELLLAAMRSGVQDFVSKPVTVVSLQPILERFQQEAPAAEVKSLEKLILVMGSKGGVGTSTVAVNLGVQLATFAKKRAVLLDLARPLGNIHLLLNLHPRFGLRDAIENVDRLDSHFFEGLLMAHKSKLEILGGALHPEQWQAIPELLLERVANVAQAAFQFVLADVGSQFGSDWTPMLLASRMILVVAETNVPSLWNLERRLIALEGLGIAPKKVGVVINRWHKGDQDTLKSIEKNIHRPILACIPNDYRKASNSVNLGMPLLENHDNYLVSHYRQLATLLTGGATAAAAGEKRSRSSFFSFPGKR